MAGGRYRVAASLLIPISLLLQIVSIATPGWVVDIQGNTEHYSSIFYKTTCKTKDLQNDCPTKAYHKMYQETKWYLDFIKSGPIPYIQQDKLMYDDVQEMTFVLVALLCTLIAFMAQILQIRNRDKNYTRIRVVSPVVIALAAGLMISVFCRKVIHNCYLSEMRDIDTDYDHTYTGFPYSLALYGGALLANTLAAIFNTYQNTGSLKKQRRNKRSYSSENLQNL